MWRTHAFWLAGAGEKDLAIKSNKRFQGERIFVFLFFLPAHQADIRGICNEKCPFSCKRKGEKLLAYFASSPSSPPAFSPLVVSPTSPWSRSLLPARPFGRLSQSFRLLFRCLQTLFEPLHFVGQRGDPIHVAVPSALSALVTPESGFLRCRQCSRCCRCRSCRGCRGRSWRRSGGCPWSGAWRARRGCGSRRS